MPTGPSTKVEFPVPVAREDRLDKGNKNRGYIGGSKSPATTTSGSGGGWQLGWTRSSNLTAPGTAAQRPRLSTNSTAKPWADKKRGGSAGASPGGKRTDGDKIRGALERKSSWTDLKKAMQSDESPHPRIPTPSTGPLLHSRSPRPHPTSTKPANSILCGSCVHIHIQLHSRVLASPFPERFPASE